MSYRRAFLSLAALLLVYLSPLIVGGEVIYPHDNSVEMGVAGAGDFGLDATRAQHSWNPIAPLTRAPISNRRFSDQSSVYVPELHHHLHGDSSGWLSLWNPHVELGRPTMQISGLSRAFVLTRVVMWFTSDALRVYTLLTALTVVLTAVFAFLFLRSLELHPWACFAAAAGIATGVFTSFWLTFVMYVSTLCWTLALLWLVTLFIRRATLARGVGIAFAIHALCITGYPQQIVWHAYLLVAYTIAALVKEHGWTSALVRRALSIAAWLVVGIASVLPVYLDLAVQVARTARLESGPAFFFSRLPSLQNPVQWGEFATRVFDAFWLGNPIDPRYAKFDGVSLTPLFSGLLVLACTWTLAKRTKLWLAFVAVGFAMTVWPSAYLFGIEHLGLNLSRFVPLASIAIPAIVASAIALDHVLRIGFARPAWAAVISSLPLLVALVASPFSRYPLHPGFMLASIAISLVFAAFVLVRKSSWLCVLVAATTLQYGYSLILSRPESEIHLTSPLVDAIRSHTPGGTRYASVISSERELLPPNQEVRLGLASIHSFDPLIPSMYKDWALRVSEVGAREFGKQFRGLSSAKKLGDDEFSYAGVSLLVSARDLEHPAVREIAEVDDLRLYEPSESPLLFAQIDGFEVTQPASTAAPGAVALRGKLGDQAQLSMSVRSATDDSRTYDVTPLPRQTLLWLSQQFHPQWRAYAGVSELETVVVNGFYQGVLVPPATREVALEFRPWARWSFIPQLCFAAAAVAMALARFARRARAGHST